MTRSEAQKIWKRLQTEIQTANEQVLYRAVSSASPSAFLNFLERHHEKLNYWQPEFSTFKAGQYGKVIAAKAMIAENGFLYLETVYYPTSPQRFGDFFSIDCIDTYSNHYVERLIERKNIHTLKALKNEITHQDNRIKNSDFLKDFGCVDLTSDYLLIFRDMVVFGYGEISDRNVAKLIRKSLITENEFKGNQQEIINFVLDEFGKEACLLTTHELPRNLSEAKNVIQDTLQRLRVVDPEERILGKEFKMDQYKQDKKMAKQFTRYLEKFDPIMTQTAELSHE